MKFLSKLDQSLVCTWSEGKHPTPNAEFCVKKDIKKKKLAHTSLQHAKIYIPSQNTWLVAQTCGPKGKGGFKDVIPTWLPLLPACKHT
jgi:hypothetical protein